MLDEMLLLTRIRNNDLKAFEKLFRLYYAPLCRYADSFIKDMNASEEIIQDLFFLMWKERDEIRIRLSVKSYLYMAARNRAFHYIRHEQVKENYCDIMSESVLETDNRTPADELEYKELETQLSDSLDHLPARQSMIFRMNRFDGKKYNEIARELSLSVKTVEAEMSKALAVLRKELKHFSNLHSLL